MLQNHRFGTGLNKYLKYIPFKDINTTSDHYFRILDAPERLYVGKTSFRIRANFDTLAQGSTIYIDIIDSAGNTIYHEVADFIGKDKSRLIVIHTYGNTPPGEATIYVAGRMKFNATTNQYIDYNNNPDSWDYIHYPNIIWTKKVVVIPTDQNNEEVLFLSSPIVSCHERVERFATAPVSARKKVVQATGSDSVSLQSTTQPFQYSNTSRYSTTFNETGNYLDLDPSGSQTFIQSNKIQVPEYFGFNTIRSENLEFSKDMVGGKITIKNPGDLNTNYSASILKVIDKNTIQVDAPFNYSDGGRNISSFVAASDFTASYISRDVTTTNFETESFVQIDLKNLEPVAGLVNKVRVSYKPYGTFGEFISVGEFPINEQNYLIDSSSLLTDKISVIEQPLGDLSGSYAYDQYWSLISNPTLNLYTAIQEAFTLDRGGSLFYTSSAAVTASQVDYLSYLKLDSEYGVNACANTEFKLELSTRYSPQTTYSGILSDYQHQQIDVYISGSGILTDDVHNTKLNTLLSTKQFGTYIGSISTLKGTTQLDSKLYFKTIDNGIIYPIFVIRSGNGWEFKEITLTPRKELGYSPNQAKLMVPINTLKTNIELVLKLEYLSGNGKKADVDTTLYGLSFTGQGFPKDRLLSGSGIMSSSGQFKTYFDFYSSSIGGFSGSIDYYDVLNRPTLISSSFQIASDISGSFNSLSASISTNKLNRVGDNILSSSIQIASDISGSWALASSSFASGKLNKIGDNAFTSSLQVTINSGILSSSFQIASDISGSSNELSSSLASGKLNKVGDSAVTSSTQIDLLATSNSDFTPVAYFYNVASGSRQFLNTAQANIPIKWAPTPTVLSGSISDYWISGSYFKLPNPGIYELNWGVHLHNPTGSTAFWLGESQNGTDTMASQSLFSASVIHDGIAIINYIYTTTGSNDRVGLLGKCSSGHLTNIPPNGSFDYSFFKVTRLKKL